MNLNKIFVLGNITREPEVRSLPSGQPVTNFSIATNRVWKDAQGQKKEEAEFHNIVCFGKLADISSQYLHKGSLVLIEGRMKTRTWQDTAGVKHYKAEIIAEGMQMGPRNSGGQSSEYNSPTKSFTPKSEPEMDQPKDSDIPIIEENYTPEPSTDEIDVKDIPF